MSETLLGVIIGGFIDIAGPLLTSFINKEQIMKNGL